MATWRPDGADRGRAPGHEQARAVDPRRGYLCRVYTDARRPVFMPLWNYAFNQGGPDPDYVYSTDRDRLRGVYRISGFRGTSRFVEITQQGFDMMSPADMGAGGPAPLTHDLDDSTLDERRLLQRRAQRRTPRGPRRRLVGARPGHPSAPDAQCSCDWNERGRRPGRDRSSRRRRRRHVARGDRAAVLRPGGVDRGHDRVRHGAGALLPRAPRGEHVHALDEDRLDGRVAEAGVLRRHPRDRRRRGADPRDRAPGDRSATGRRSSPTTASAPSTG